MPVCGLGCDRRPRRLTTPLAWVTIALTLAASLIACSSNSDSFVRRAGDGFTRNGKPLRFVGFNIYDSAATERYACNPTDALTEQELSDVFRFIRDQSGASVVRFWAFQNYTNSGSDWSGVDRVIRAAKSNNLLLLPVLENGPGECTTNPSRQPKNSYQGDTWYVSGYRQPYGKSQLSYRDYVRLIAERYRDEPSILGWSMINEADTSTRNALGHSALVDFARDISAVIRTVDPHHLITLGTQGNGAPGASGRDFYDVHAVPGIDFSEVHDWGYWGSDTVAMPGSTDGRSLPDPDSEGCMARDAPIACSFAWARRLQKPLLVGEVGIAAEDSTQRQRRANLLRNKMTAAFAAGADGYLVWHLNPRVTDGYDVRPHSDDPLFATLSAEFRKVGDSQ